MTLHWKDDPRPLKQICLVDAFAPDIQLGFNDSQYDWPFIMEKANKLHLIEWILGEMTTSNEYSSIKENAKEGVEEFRRDSVFIKVSPEDVFKSSFLKIPGCVPIDVRACFKRLYPRSENYYSEAKECSSDITARNMHEVANYCIIDALLCQELVVKRNVRNLLGAYAFKHDMVFSTRVCKNIEKGKYPGAYVFLPKKGIEMKRPVTGLDFASLYPSLIMAYNLFPEKIILNEEEADIAQKNGNNLHKIEFLFNDRTFCAWSFRHDSCPEKKKKERLEKLISTVEKKEKIVSDTLKSKYASLYFDYNCLNSKQFALKVYMNTFYGEAGNSKSPFFLRELAGGITSAGQYNINLVADYVTKKSFGIKYGDTDSLYLTCPDEYYKKCDEAFARGELSKKAYWTEMIKITMKVMDNFRNKVNTFFKVKNSTSYLKMAYEEVLFPVCFTGDSLYDENGKKQPQRVANYMEFPDIAKELNTEIDISHYLEQTVGLYTRFINDDKRYQPSSSYKIMQLKDSDKKEKQIDAYSQKEAKRWLTKYIKALN
ncbi:DNA polymerase family B-domain-containing protein [Gigaspora rosea]|uniref:DNA polymerase n=1 Tax=Gigaspora rosea TaxID=44941 RepID=A0A397VJ59_9GLOM|nr:DNA polymerase family B-domain-containing protein [Gigaspora rosea]